MIPWFFAYGRINYSRYLPCYYMEMKALQNTHPFVHDGLADGEFAVQRPNSPAFSMTACDQIIEQTFNRDSKTRGGLTGITLNKGAVRRWILSHPARAGIANACYSMSISDPDSASVSKELSSSRIKTDEQSVQDVMTTVTCFANPFNIEEEKELVNICSGKVAPETVTSDLSTAYTRGEECFKDFVSQRLVEGTKDVFDKLTLPTSKTFSDLSRREKSKGNESSLMKERRQLLTRMVIIAQEKGLDLQQVMRYQLSSVPPSLANPDGSLVKTNKATLVNQVEKLMPSGPLPKENIPSNTVLIVDGMALIQQQRQIPETFGDFACIILKKRVSMGLKHKAKRVDFVADRYQANSIKQFERSKRANLGETKVRINRKDQKMPKQFKKYLANGDIKEGLLLFLVNEWKEIDCDLSGIEIYATQGDFCCKISRTEGDSLNVEDIPELLCDQEEADTRMFLHALHA
ncbi:uncharacterized protein LOC124265368 isoform X1 [Haliotis rubra]|uniref:uncharacterized protein LOC124265368 isoform X1 n=1 Tax=Haliotis rubra TaxID=36100 RepID=UPI001EE6046A|nr:uncharacterized protein LOC124265368 isoform X1 [Haliotis rubra]